MFKLNRSITGTGNKKTLEKVRKIIPIKIKKYHLVLKFMTGKFQGVGC